MKYFYMGLALCVSFLFGFAAQKQFMLLDVVPVPTIIISDEARREHYLMPKKDTPTYKEWVAKYGDSADSWGLFTTAFHTRYLGELNQRISKLEKKNDTNEPNK